MTFNPISSYGFLGQLFGCKQGMHRLGACLLSLGTDEGRMPMDGQRASLSQLPPTHPRKSFNPPRPSLPLPSRVMTRRRSVNTAQYGQGSAISVSSHRTDDDRLSSRRATLAIWRTPPVVGRKSMIGGARCFGLSMGEFEDLGRGEEVSPAVCVRAHQCDCVCICASLSPPLSRQIPCQRAGQRHSPTMAPLTTSSWPGRPPAFSA